MGKRQQRRTEASITQATGAQLAEQSSQQARQQQVLQNQKEAYKSFEFQNRVQGFHLPLVKVNLMRHQEKRIEFVIVLLL